MIKYPPDYDPIRDYWAAIQSGEEVVCSKIRKTYEKVIADLDDNKSEYFYSPARANHVIEFVENFCHNSKGKYGGQLVVLELWEKALLATVFGFVDIEGNRKYREAVLILGKKNGKSLLASCVGLYLLTADNEPGAEVYAVASKREQAKIVWQEAVNMVKKSPALRKRIKPLVGELRADFCNGTFKPLASDSNTLDGLNVHGALLDEVHAWKNGKALYDIVVDGVSAREQPLVFLTSTAGTIREDIFDQKYAEAERVINGYSDKNGYRDDRFIAFIYELDNRNEWDKPECWKKANPGLGTIKNLNTLKAKVEKAKANPLLVKNLICKEFNIRETSSSAWLTFDQLNNEAKFDITELKPRYCIGGLDLSNSNDLTCATVIFRVPDDPILYVKQMYWLPADRLEERVTRDKIPYDKWHDQGWLRLSPGNRVDYKDVTAWFVEVQRDLDCYVYKVGYDPWNSSYVIDDLKKTFGESVTEEVRQGAKTMSGPMGNFAADLTAKKINYNDNPVLKWNLSNAAVEIDRNNNIALVKAGNQNLKKIDGVASLLDAYVVLERNYENYMGMI